MSEKILTIFIVHVGGEKTTTERILLIMLPNLRQTGLFWHPTPRAAQHSGDRLTLVGEFIGRLNYRIPSDHIEAGILPNFRRCGRRV